MRNQTTQPINELMKRAHSSQRRKCQRPTNMEGCPIGHHQRNAQATLRVCVAPVRMAMKKTHTTNANEDVDKQGLLHILGRNAN